MRMRRLQVAVSALTFLGAVNRPERWAAPQIVPQSVPQWMDLPEPTVTVVVAFIWFSPVCVPVVPAEVNFTPRVGGSARGSGQLLSAGPTLIDSEKPDQRKRHTWCLNSTGHSPWSLAARRRA